MPKDDSTTPWLVLPTATPSSPDPSERPLHVVPEGFDRSICGVPVHLLAEGPHSGEVCPLCEPSQEIH